MQAIDLDPGVIRQTLGGTLGSLLVGATIALAYVHGLCCRRRKTGAEIALQAIWSQLCAMRRILSTAFIRLENKFCSE